MRDKPQAFLLLSVEFECPTTGRKVQASSRDLKLESPGSPGVLAVDCICGRQHVVNIY